MGDRQPVVTTNDDKTVITTTTTTTQTNPPPPPPNAIRPKDPNAADPRLLLNGTPIYERPLPGNAYITAHVQRLQHGYYSSPATSKEQDFDHVDFLAVNFVFHAPHTLTHRFRAATIRASVGSRDICPALAALDKPKENPRFLVHAPHLIYGAVSPENLRWSFSLGGSLGVSQMPFNASFAPAGSMNESYKRYEMMRIQGSVRTRISPWGSEFDVEAGEIVWSLEENTLQRSGLPREFTFIMLIQKPRADSNIMLLLDIEPEIQNLLGRVPRCWLALPRYQPIRRRTVDFRQEIGQRFEPVMSEKGFNFADMASCLEEYVHMPGSTYNTKISPDGVVPGDTGSNGNSNNANGGGGSSNNNTTSNNATGGNANGDPNAVSGGFTGGFAGGFKGVPAMDGPDDTFRRSILPLTSGRPYMGVSVPVRINNDSTFFALPAAALGLPKSNDAGKKTNFSDPGVRLNKPFPDPDVDFDDFELDLGLSHNPNPNSTVMTSYFLERSLPRLGIGKRWNRQSHSYPSTRVTITATANTTRRQRRSLRRTRSMESLNRQYEGEM